MSAIGFETKCTHLPTDNRRHCDVSIYPFLIGAPPPPPKTKPPLLILKKCLGYNRCVSRLKSCYHTYLNCPNKYLI